MAKFDKLGEAGAGSFSPPAFHEGRGWGAQALGHGQFLPPVQDGTTNGLHVPVLAMVPALGEWGAMGSAPCGEAGEHLARRGWKPLPGSPGVGYPEGQEVMLLGFIVDARSFYLPTTLSHRKLGWKAASERGNRSPNKAGGIVKMGCTCPR